MKVRHVGTANPAEFYVLTSSLPCGYLVAQIKADMHTSSIYDYIEASLQFGQFFWKQSITVKLKCNWVLQPRSLYHILPCLLSLHMLYPMLLASLVLIFPEYTRKTNFFFLVRLIDWNIQLKSFVANLLIFLYQIKGKSIYAEIDNLLLQITWKGCSGLNYPSVVSISFLNVSSHIYQVYQATTLHACLLVGLYSHHMQQSPIQDSWSCLWYSLAATSVKVLFLVLFHTQLCHPSMCALTSTAVRICWMLPSCWLVLVRYFE